MFTNIYYNFAYHKNTMKLTCPLFFSQSQASPGKGVQLKELFWDPDQIIDGLVHSLTNWLMLWRLH